MEYKIINGKLCRPLGGKEETFVGDMWEDGTLLIQGDGPDTQWPGQDQIYRPTEGVVLSVVCAWCKEELKPGTAGAPVSHGMCEACGEELFKIKKVFDDHDHRIADMAKEDVE